MIENDDRIVMRKKNPNENHSNENHRIEKLKIILHQ